MESFPSDKKISHYGPGGRFCNCCGPSPSKRKVHDRTVKRRGKEMAKKEWVKDMPDPFDIDDPAPM